MAARPRPVPALLRIDLTAMIDVIFLLLIFWMMVARLSSEPPVSVEAPISHSDAIQRPGPQVWTVEVPDDATDRVRAAGRWMPVEELRATLASAPLPPAVLVRADARADAVRVQSVLSAIAQAGIERVGLAVREAQP